MIRKSVQRFSEKIMLKQDDFIAMTHSCWNREPCGTCPACVAREVALRDSGPPAK
jgi:7-cyano-7-deazaguanine synthase in queuosine biosynthesis